MRCGGIVASVLVVALSACGGAPPGRAARLPHHPPLPNQPPSGVVRVGPDSVQILHGGAVTFTTLSGLVAAAHSSVDVEMYEFGRPDMRDALLAAHNRGVAVTVIVDPTVDVSAATEATLRSAGVDVLDYPVHKLMIDHVKLMVVDGVVGVVGGINWGIGSERNHDVDAVVRGPVVRNLLRVFQRDLITAGRSVAVPDAVADVGLLVATTLPGTDIRPLVMQTIAAATTTLDLELFVVTDTGVVSALVSARQRGVAVRVLLDPSQRPSDGPAAVLRSGGVDVRIYSSGGEKLHAKFVVADSRTVVFGSANWSKGGFERNHECDVEIVDSPELATDFEVAVSADWDAAA